MQITKPHRTLIYLSLGFTSILIIELICILIGNQGHLVFSLDDAYIHFALAENLVNGHYGVNLEEVSAPSSSILWPFLLAPFTYFNSLEWIVLFINSLFALITLFFIWHLIDPILRGNTINRKITYTLVFFFLMAIGNLVGLVFTGMEHSLQVMLACMIVAGLWQQACLMKTPNYLFFALVLIPLIRYESLAITLPAMMYLYYNGQRRNSFITGLVIASVIIAFSFFLYQNQLGILPTSILAKSGHNAQNNNLIGKLLGNAISNLINPIGWLLLGTIFSLIPALKNTQLERPKRQFALVLFTAGWLHLLVGSLWWYGRYETYVLISMVLGSLLLHQQKIQHLWLQNKSLPLNLKVITPLFILSLPSIFILLTTPTMSGVIYRQPYQFHRLVSEYYPKPVALNDLGLVSYKNDYFVLDLWGLANKKALQYRMDRKNPAWMHSLIEQHDIGLVFVTESWFRKVPEPWVKVAEFDRNDFLARNSRGALGKVAFYATDQHHVAPIKSALAKFRDTLPAPVTLEWVE